MKTLLLMSFLAIFISCTPTVSDIGSSRNQRINPLALSYWPAGLATFPLTVNISSSFDATENTAIQSGATSWSTTVSNNTTFFDTNGTVAEKGGSLNSYSDSSMGVYKITSWPSELPGSALAVTQIFGLRRNIGTASEAIEITHADILVNYDDWSFSTTGGSGFDLETVLLHEFGHFLGLGHNDSSVSESVMYPNVSSLTTNRVPRALDTSAITSLYNIGGVVSASATRSIASIDNQASQDFGITESVVMQFELNSDGSERLKINNKYIDYKCNH